MKNLEMQLRKAMVALGGSALLYCNFCLIEAAYILRCDGYLSTTETDTLSVGLLIGAVGLINWLVFKTKKTSNRHYFTKKKEEGPVMGLLLFSFCILILMKGSNKYDIRTKH